MPTISESVSFSCPFCIGGKVTAGLDDNGDGAVFHTVPECERFLVLDEEPAEFLKAAREKIRQTDRNLS